MAWRICKNNNFPLGKRLLRFNCQGRDVRELQQILLRYGFYFGACDGSFGILTYEAVLNFQRTLGLSPDGIAGREVFKTIANLSQKTGRIVHTVKEGENLAAISQKFGVLPDAWQTISGPGHPKRRIYPGMKLFLPEKAFFDFAPPQGPNADRVITGSLTATWTLRPDGALEAVHPPHDDPSLHLISAAPEVWEQYLVRPRLWRQTIRHLKDHPRVQAGFDLRHAPPDTILYWKRFLGFMSQGLAPQKIAFLLLPFGTWPSPASARLFRLSLPSFTQFTKAVALEPILRQTTPQTFITSMQAALRTLRAYAKSGLAPRILLVDRVAGWDWNLKQNECHEISESAAKLIRAAHTPAEERDPLTGLLQMHYQHHQEPHCLIYRDTSAWLSVFKRVVAYHLSGIVLRDFQQLKTVGPQILARSFAVMPGSKF